ncbi:hypothetical protein L6452_20017 [Arctium lappa]|uniref:Uncharacterized protein n=1 Tax=Arctium lappa TaxID=4217 RepID=A0ACB9BEK5_ARCLA|nr:hypothetical protein L6452_20017 [Arctium lappa]
MTAAARRGYLREWDEFQKTVVCVFKWPPQLRRRRVFRRLTGLVFNYPISLLVLFPAAPTVGFSETPPFRRFRSR